MSKTESQARPPFSIWLKAVAAKTGATTALELRQVLVRHGCHAPEILLDEWLEGVSEPSLDKMRELITALNKALEDIDVWEEHRRYLRGEPYLLEPRREQPGQLPATLEDFAQFWREGP